jgi:hypothetical protein
MTMNCLEFRKAAGTDPQHLDASALEHARDCPACTRYLAETRELDVRIAHALSIKVPAAGGAAASNVVKMLPRAIPPRRRAFALAASVFLAVGVGTAGWLLFPRPTLADEVVEHMNGEPDSWNSHTPADVAALQAALTNNGARFTTSLGRMMYAQSCLFRGHHVPHLVLETGAAPVTLLLLPNESVKARTNFAAGGYEGVLLPVGKGSVAVLTHGAPLPEELAARIAKSIEWTK